MRALRALPGLAAAAAIALFSPITGANGRFPEASIMAFDPGDDDHIVVSSTFGLLETRDGGRNFSWTCEGVIGLVGMEDMMLAVAEGGAIVGGTFNGVTRSADGCSFSKPPELDGEIVGDIALSRGSPRTVFGFRTVGLGSSRFDSQIVRSDDAGESWVRLEPPLIEAILPLTIDVAPSDPDRLYVTGRLGSADEYRSLLLRSDDGGLSFVETEIPETSNQRLAFVSAVDPNDADHVYVRVDDPLGTVVWHSLDAGASFERLFTGSARLPGFARSPDGSRIAFGGPNDGIWVGNADGSGFERRSDIAPSCLGWSSDGLYACADANLTGFSIGRSSDEALSFEPLVRFRDLCGNTACGAGTPAAEQCPMEWEFVAAQVISATCGLPDPPGGAGGGGGKRGDSGCAFTGSRTPAAPALIGSFAVLLFAFRRRAARRVS